jgi:hypothetical protein
MAKPRVHWRKFTVSARLDDEEYYALLVIQERLGISKREAIGRALVVFEKITRRQRKY